MLVISGGSRLDGLDILEILLPYNVTVLTFDFTGSGRSQGVWMNTYTQTYIYTFLHIVSTGYVICVCVCMCMRMCMCMHMCICMRRHICCHFQRHWLGPLACNKKPRWCTHIYNRLSHVHAHDIMHVPAHDIMCFVYILGVRVTWLLWERRSKGTGESFAR